MSGPADRGGTLTGWLLLLAALYGLNLALSFHNVWPTLMVEDRRELSLEIALLMLAMGLAAEFRGPPGRRTLGWLSLLLLLLVLGRYAEVTAPALFGRAINLYWDARYVPDVLAMLGQVAPAWQVTLAVVGLAALLALTWAALRWCLGRVAWGLARSLPRRGVTAGAALLVALYYSVYLGIPARPAGWYALPVTATYAGQARFLAHALAGDAVADSLPPAPPLPGDLAAVRDTDVFIVFVESYGAAAWDRPDIAAALADSRTALGDAIIEGGRGVVSAYVDAPTFGGGSWLSHASLLAGVEVRDQGRYSLLLTQTRETLVSRFSERGHRAVALMPGLQAAWPEGVFYGFDRIYGADALHYRGPPFAWWRIPDQYALAQLAERELGAGDRAPRLVVFPTISSHMPFRPTPPYQPDWSRLLGQQPFEEAATQTALAARPDWSDLAPAYAGAIDYTQRWLAGWLARPSPRPLLAIILGDHQPPAAVAGRDAPWQVPVHVVGSDPALLEALVAAGFRRGLTPARPSLGPMHSLHALLLAVLDGGDSEMTIAAGGSSRDR